MSNTNGRDCREFRHQLENLSTEELEKYLEETTHVAECSRCSRLLAEHEQDPPIQKTIVDTIQKLELEEKENK